VGWRGEGSGAVGFIGCGRESCVRIAASVSESDSKYPTRIHASDRGRFHRTLDPAIGGGEALSVSLTGAKTRKKVEQSGRPQWACSICQTKKAEKTYTCC
jgi:hypothetical protein